VFETSKVFEGEAGLPEERVRQLIYFSSRRLYLARQKRTTFEARDRPYVTILKSVPSHPWKIDPTRKSSPRAFARTSGAHLFLELGA